MIHDYLILGGGMSGIAAGRLLQLSGVENFLILEGTSELGGLCRTKQVGAHVLDVGGGHFLCTKYPEVYDFVFNHLAPGEFNYFDRVSRIAVDGCEVDYPLESNIWQLPAELCADYLISVAQNGEARGLPAPTNFETWIRWKLGDRVAERYMLPYNRKIWGVPAHQMDIDWLHKIPRLDVKQIALACLNRHSDRRQMPSHSGFYYPKEGGFQRIFDAIARPVLAHVEAGTPARTIERQGEVLVVNGRFRARRIINTVPWGSLADSPVFTEPVRQAIARLLHNRIVVSLHEENYRTNAHWLYQPDLALRHHRSFFIHNFAPHSAPNGFYRETNAERWQAHSSDLWVEDNRHAYPVPTLGWAAAIGTVLDHCTPLNIHGLGRWGQWQYFNSDVCIKEAMSMITRLGHSDWTKKIGPIKP